MLGVVPSFLTPLPRWVLWREDIDAKSGRLSKRPYRVDNGGLASSTNPASWSSYDAAYRAAMTHPSAWRGIGVTLGLTCSDEVLAGVDLDRWPSC